MPFAPFVVVLALTGDAVLASGVADAAADDGAADRPQTSDEANDGQRPQSPDLSKLDSEALDAMDLESLLDLPIVTASKQRESVFETPVSASVLTQSDLRRAGVLSVAEALRLMPGSIVREAAPGVFDVHVRGFDSVPPAVMFWEYPSRTTLVMVDNRIVFSDFNGGTLWEALPVNISDVTAIELVRGPASALYGPNAATGVIHIITGSPPGNGLRTKATVQLWLAPQSTRRSLDATLGEAALAYGAGPIDIHASAGWTERYRHVQYYRALLDDPASPFLPRSPTSRVDDPLDITPPAGPEDPDEWPEPLLAARSRRAQVSLRYTPSDTASVTLRAGLERSLFHGMTMGYQGATLAMLESATQYVQVQSSLRALTVRLSYTGGAQGKYAAREMAWTYDQVDAEVEYAWDLGALRLKPTVQLRNSAYRSWLLHHRDGHWLYAAAALRGEYRMQRLCLVAAVRADAYVGLGRTSLPIHVGATYALAPSHVLRLGYGRAFQGVSMATTFLLGERQLDTGANPAGFLYTSDPDHPLRTVDAVEAGYRGQPFDGVQVDAAVFASWMTHISTFQGHLRLPSVELRMSATEATARQVGATASVELRERGGRTRLRLFVTAQDTRLQDYSSNYIFARTERRDGPDASTPSFFGGFELNRHFSERMTVNVNGYAYSEQTFHHSLRASAMHVRPKTIINATLSYDATEQLELFLSARNLLHGRREVPLSDKIYATVLGGVRIDWSD